jgi:hypothetical protein
MAQSESAVNRGAIFRNNASERACPARQDAINALSEESSQKSDGNNR